MNEILTIQCLHSCPFSTCQSLPYFLPGATSRGSGEHIKETSLQEPQPQQPGIAQEPQGLQPKMKVCNSLLTGIRFALLGFQAWLAEIYIHHAQVSVRIASCFKMGITLWTKRSLRYALMPCIP